MAQIGNKINSYLNGEWAKHYRDRPVTSGLRRMESKEIILREMLNCTPAQEDYDYEQAAEIMHECMYDFDYPWEMVKGYVIGVKTNNGIRMYNNEGTLMEGSRNSKP